MRVISFTHSVFAKERIYRWCLIASMVTIFVCAEPPKKQEFIPFSFKKKSLIDLLEQFAPQDSNLLYPQRAADLDILKQQYVTYLPHEEKIAPRTAWNILNTLLELSGFSLFKKDNQFIIVRNASVEGGAINREPLPMYTGMLPSTLPDDSRIIYIHYLKNLKVPDPSEKDTHPLSMMLKQLLSYNASLLFDPRSNAIILIDKAPHAASIARLLQEFDKHGTKEHVAYIPLKHLPAQDIVTIFESLKLAAGPEAARTVIKKGSPTLNVLTEDTKIVADPIQNGIILMGRQAHVERIIDFIEESLDVPQDRGSSILHYYDLNYLDNVKTAAVLNRIVSSVIPAGEQATAEGTQKPSFQGVVVAALEQALTKPKLATENIAIEQKGFQEVEQLNAVATNGGNRLIIAAREKDWHIVKKLIQQIDTRQRHVLLEVLAVEFAYDRTTNLSGTIRSQTDSAVLPQGVQYLASHITPVISVLGTSPTQLATDLLQIIGPGSVTNQIGQGSMLISLNDPKTPGIFGLLEILKTVVSSRITSYPYITVKNNTEGVLNATNTIRTTGDLVYTTGGTATIPIIDLPATFSVNIVPHIVSDTRLRLVIGFTDDRFTNPAKLTRRTQELKTTATLNTGEILVMGGLLRIDTNDKGSITPILGHVPIFSSFFRGTQAETITTNLTLFIMPTILEPRSKETEMTNRHICDNKDYIAHRQTQSMLRDPIYRLFLRDESDQQIIDNFISQSTQNTTCGPKILQSEPSKQILSFDSSKLKQVLSNNNILL